MQGLIKKIKEKKEEMNNLYKSLNDESPHPLVKRALELCELKDNPHSRQAVLRRLIDLKDESLCLEFKKERFSEKKQREKKDAVFTLVASLYEVEHASLIDEARQFLSGFDFELMRGVHELGVVMNAFTRTWQKNIIDKNHDFLKEDFKSLELALDFLDNFGLYQKNEKGQKADRCYGGLLKFGNRWTMNTYAKLFSDYILQLDIKVDKLIKNLKSFEHTEERAAFIKYFELLRAAFNELDNDKVILAWQAVELAWMDIKGPLQIGHPLEYYEDPYAKSVALEWDVRIKDDYPFDELAFSSKIKASFKHIYEAIAIENEALFKAVNDNIAKTQCYICLPFTFYGANLNGLFSAQVVPNDEFVSQKAGKKIFAFLNQVYMSAKARPFLKLPSLVFDEDFLKYSRELLFFNESLWKKCYEISTIGHEYGHILFIGEDTEQEMSKSGVFKNIEEFKATMGGLVSFFLHEEKELIKPVFTSFIQRAVGLISWQRILEVQPYYCEGLLELELLFSSGVLDFQNQSLLINTNQYQSFKELALKRYEELAKHYLLKKDAKDFLQGFVLLENDYYLPKDEKIKAFVRHYYALYEKYGNEIDTNETLKVYKA